MGLNPLVSKHVKGLRIKLVKIDTIKIGSQDFFDGRELLNWNTKAREGRHSGVGVDHRSYRHSRVRKVNIRISRSDNFRERHVIQIDISCVVVDAGGCEDLTSGLVVD